MAKRTTKSKALGYQETFFANRNDMLQSALDAVLLKIDNEQARYAAEVELYKESSKLIVRERERLQKLVDSLKKGQIDKDLSVAQFNAGQQNSTARTAASIEAANARFNAKQAALAAYYGTRGFSAGRDPSNAVTLNETQQAYNANPGNIGSGFATYYQQTQVTSGVPKTSDDIDKGSALLFNQYVAAESRKSTYDIFDDPQDRVNAAKDNLLEGLPEADKAAVERGLVKLNPQAAAGAGLVIDETGKVNVGGIDVRTVGGIDYSPLIADAEARLGRIKDAEAKAPVAPEEPDLIDLQRREYFDKFYSGYVPRYEMNEIMQRLIDLPDREAQAFKDLYQSRYSPVAGMETPTGARRVRDLPTTPGGVIGGEGSPFVPTDRFSAKGREILGNIPSNQFYLEDIDAVNSDPRIQSLNQQLSELAGMADSTAGPMGGLSPFNIFASRLTEQRDALISEALQERANLLFAEGFGLQKTLKEDGRTLYTVVPFDQLGQYPADQVVMPDRTSPFYRGTPNTKIDELDVDQSQPLDQSIDDLVQELARIDVELKKAYSPVPVSPAVAGLGPVSSKEQVSALESSKRSLEDQLDNLLMRRIEAGSGPEQQVVKRSDMVLVPAQSYLGDFGDMGTVRRETEPVFDFAEPRRLQPVTGDRAEVRRILNDPERQRYKDPFKITEPPAPAPAPEKKELNPDQYEEESILEFSKKNFVTDPTNYDYKYKSDGRGGFEIEFKGKKLKPAPAGSDAAKAIEGVLTAPEIEAKEAPTPEQTDAKVKFNAAEKAQSIYGTPEFDKLLKTELGRAVSDLYSVNKAKGDESGGEVLSYIATEFPRAEDQSKAAQILMGLSYADKTKGLLGAKKISTIS